MAPTHIYYIRKSWELMARKLPTNEVITIEDEGEATQRLREGNEGDVEAEDISEIAQESWYIGKTVKEPPAKKLKITDYFAKTSKK